MTDELKAIALGVARDFRRYTYVPTPNLRMLPTTPAIGHGRPDAPKAYGAARISVLRSPEDALLRFLMTHGLASLSLSEPFFNLSEEIEPVHRVLNGRVIRKIANRVDH